MVTAYSKPIQINSWEAAADLSTKFGLALKLNGSTKLALCGAGEASIGPCQATIGAFGAGKVQMADVITHGISKGISGAAFGDGDVLSADAAGKYVKQTPGAAGVAIALDDASGADIMVPILVLSGGGISGVGLVSLTAGVEGAAPGGANTILVTAQVKNAANGANIAAATRLAARSNDAGATLTDGGAGTCDFGTGTVQAEFTTDATGKAEILVSDIAAESVVIEILGHNCLPAFITLTFA